MLFSFDYRVFCRGCYNAISKSVEAELLPALRTLNMSFYAYNPLGGGLLTGRYKTKEDVENATVGRFSSEVDFVPDTNKMEGLDKLKGKGNLLYRIKYGDDLNFRAIKLIDEVIIEGKATQGESELNMVEVALRWMKNHSWLRGSKEDAIIFGASKVHQCEGKMKALAKGDLPKPVVEACNQAGVITAPIADPYLRGYGRNLALRSAILLRSTIK